MKKLAPILAVGALGALTACTPSEVDRWLGWWQDDPQAAEDYANQDWVQRSLEWGCDSYCDVDDPEVQQPASSDESSSTENSSTDSDSGGGGDTSGVYEPWISLAACESGGNWSINTGNGYYGGLQFTLESWHAAGGSGYPQENSAAEQVRVAENLQDMQGWGAWPACSAKLGL